MSSFLLTYFLCCLCLIKASTAATVRYVRLFLSLRELGFTRGSHFFARRLVLFVEILMALNDYVLGFLFLSVVSSI